MTNIIEVKDLVKRYKKAETNAVDTISFNVENGEFFTLLGPNGAGKTTTISILNTTLAKTSGMVKVNGKEIDEDPAEVRNSIGVIFQNPSLDLNLTAEENVRLHAILYGLYPYRPTYDLMPEAYKKKVDELADVLGIKDDIHKPIKTFSGGMKRKLEIVRGLIHKPKILFLDEPTTGLDPQSRKNLWEYLKEVRTKDRITLFLTTHYLEEAEGSDRICVINKGKIVSMGTPTQIKKELVDEYLLIDGKNREELLEELNKRKIEYEMDGVIKIKIKKEKEIQDILKELKSDLNTISVHSPTLEEAYLEIINREEQNEKP